jgi:hypothetical protein
LASFAADLRDRGADRIGAIAMFDADHLGHAGQLAWDQKRTAADRDQRHVAGPGLYAIDGVFELCPCYSERGCACGTLATHFTSPNETTPAATAAPVAVNVLPPNTSASSVRRSPTLCGPVDAAEHRTQR